VGRVDDPGGRGVLHHGPDIANFSSPVLFTSIIANDQDRGDVTEKFWRRGGLRGVDLESTTSRRSSHRAQWRRKELALEASLRPAQAGLGRIEVMHGYRAVKRAGLTPIRSNSAFLFQGAALFDSMTLFDNVAFPCAKRHRPVRRWQHRVAGH